MTVIAFTVEGPAHGKGRPRFDSRSKRAYTPRATEKAEDRVRWAWRAAGSQRFDGPLVLVLGIVVERPKGHWRLDGSLSAAGARAPWPTRKPDVSNVIKTFEDALNGCAYADDQQIVSVHAVRRWASPGESEHTTVEISAVPSTGVVQAVRAVA